MEYSIDSGILYGSLEKAEVHVFDGNYPKSNIENGQELIAVFVQSK